MIKNRISGAACRFRRFPIRAAQVISRHPVEILLCLAAFVSSVWIGQEIPDRQEERIISMLFWTPPLFFLAYALNRRFTGRRRWTYYGLLLLLFPAAGSGIGAAEGPSAPQFILWMSALVLFFTGEFIRENRSFTARLLGMVLNLAYAAVFALLCLLFLWMISGSINLILLSDSFFGTPRVAEYLARICWILLFPFAFLTFDAGETAGTGEEENTFDTGVPRFIGILVRYVCTPALLAYTAVLYLYFLKIAIQWDLPRTAISVMVFVYLLIAFLVKAINNLQKKQAFPSFYRNLEKIALIPLLMMWAASVYRIQEYGFTMLRFYLLLSNIALTAATLCMMSKKCGHYVYITSGTVVLFWIFTFIPSISARQIGLRSQISRIERIGSRLGLLDSQGKFRSDIVLVPGDSLLTSDYEELIGAFTYYQQQQQADTVSLQPARIRFGTDAGLLSGLLADANIKTGSGRSSYLRYLYNSVYPAEDIRRFGRMYTYDSSVHAYNSFRQIDTLLQDSSGKRAGTLMIYTGDTLRLQIDYNTFRQQQARKLGVSPDTLFSYIRNLPYPENNIQSNRLLTLDTLGMRIRFESAAFAPDTRRIAELRAEQLFLP